jgi:type II secretory pathway component PulL
MARFDPQQRGSRRRIAQIRWRRWEVIHVFILLLLMMVFSIWVGIWIATHNFD